MATTVSPEPIVEPVSVDDNSSSLTVDGTVAATLSEPISVDDNAGSLTVDNSTLAVVGGGTEAAAMRVTLANDSTGLISVDDNSGSLTVDGTVGVSGTVTVDSELPAAAALADNTGNPTVPGVGAFVLGYDGTNWDRVRADGGALFIQDGGNTITVDGTVSVTEPVSVDDNGSSLTVDQATPSSLQMVSQPHTSGGLTTFRSLDLDETEEEIKASAGQVYGWFIANTATATRFVKFYNATAANVTVGSTTPVLTFPIPGNTSDDIAANALGGHGIAFDTAITVAATTGVADADTGAPAANDVIINVFYK